MQPATHRIRRQRWLCTARTPAEGFALRAGLRQAQESVVPALFETAFDAVAPGGDAVYLPRLELRLRLERVDDLAAVLPDLLARALREQLGPQLGRQPGHADAAESFRRPASLPREEEAAAGGEEKRRSLPAITVRETRLDGLVAYLTTGVVPWELAREAATPLAEAFREIAREELAVVLERAPGAGSPLAQRAAFFHRLLQLVGEERWSEVGESLLHRLPEVEALPGKMKDSKDHKGTRDGESRELQEGVSLAGLLRILRSFSSLASLASSQGSQETTPEPGPSHKLPPSPGPHRAALPDNPPGPLPAPHPPGGASDTPPPPAGASVAPQPPAEEAPAAFPLAVRHAGLVLLHPFLPRLFDHLGLLRAGEPGLPWTALPRAAALLHALATGRDEVLEFEIPFIKVLLGRLPDEPLLVTGGELTAADREEGEALLQAVVGHWRALKSTTPSGLRASFLQRVGLLRGEDDGWRLQVEPAAFDLLLNHLPWGIGVVKLPWMTRPIFTEWPTP